MSYGFSFRFIGNAPPGFNGNHSSGLNGSSSSGFNNSGSRSSLTYRNSYGRLQRSGYKQFNNKGKGSNHNQRQNGWQSWSGNTNTWFNLQAKCQICLRRDILHLIIFMGIQILV